MGTRAGDRSYELRDLFERNGHPFTFIEQDSDEGRALLQQAGHPDGPFPVVILRDGQALTDPSREEIVVGFLGAQDTIEGGPYDLTIVGPDLLDCLRRSTARQKGCARSSWNAKRLVGKLAPVHLSATTWDFRKGSVGRTSPIGHLTRPGSSALKPPSCAPQPISEWKGLTGPDAL